MDNANAKGAAGAARLKERDPQCSAQAMSTRNRVCCPRGRCPVSKTTTNGKDEVREVAEKPSGYHASTNIKPKPQRPPGNAGVWDKRSF